MYPFTIASLLQVLDGTLLRGWPRDKIQGPEIEIMIRLRNAGGEYIHRLIRSRKSCVVVPPDFEYRQKTWAGTHVSIIQVPDTRAAAYATAEYIRSNLRIPVVQVSGSAGKSTTKEMTGAVLRELHPLVSLANQNALGGVSHNLRRVSTRHGAAVLEVGMNGAGQLSRISEILRPDILIITCIQREHLLRLGSLDNIIQAKAEALEHLSPDGLLVINGDDPNCAKFPVHRFPGTVMRFGFSQSYDVWATDVQQHEFHTNFVAHSENFSIRCRIATFGRYNVSNALAAICIGYHLGLSPRSIALGLSKFRPMEGRLRIERGIAGRLCIDDWYNANPDSTSLLLQELVPLARKRQLVLVLGDQERPDAPAVYAAALHYNLGKQVAALQPAYLLAVGKWARDYMIGAIAAGFPANRTAWYLTTQQARKRLAKILRPRQLVVFKASRFVNPDERLIFGNADLKILV